AAVATLRPVAEYSLGFDEHDATRVRAALADALVVHDHRLAGIGLLEGADAYLESLAALWRLSPDDHIERRFDLAHERYGGVAAGQMVGTLPGGGTYERPLVAVYIVAGGRITRVEFFEPEDVAAALARVARLRPVRLRIPPNAATRTDDRGLDAVVAGDWEAVAETCAPSLVFEDRRRLVRITGDRDMFIANCKLGGGLTEERLARTVLATAGDRLALARLRRSSEGGLAAFGMDVATCDEPESEIEHLLVTEVDAEGRLVAVIMFDPGDRHAATVEMLERYARSDAARCIPAGAFEVVRALNARDLDRLRAALPDDFAVNDRRRTGTGRVESADRYVASVVAVFEQTSELTIEILHVVAAEKHGHLAMTHTFGTLADGGEFELVYVWLALFQGDRFVGMELFEPDDLDIARARFEELRQGTSPGSDRTDAEGAP